MKKVAILFVCCMMSICLFAGSVSTGAVGLTFWNTDKTVTFEGSSATGHNTMTALSSNFDWINIAEGSKAGLDVGFSILYPLSASLDGYSVNAKFFDCFWCPRIGGAWETKINDNLTMHGSFGYEMMFNFESEYVSGLGTVNSTLFIHGIYGQDCLILKEDGFNINFGANAYVPIFGSNRISASGYESEKYSIIYTGIVFTPFIGFSIQK